MGLCGISMQVIDQMHHGRGELGGLLSPSLYVSGVSSSECAIGLDSVSEPDSPDRFPGGQRTGSAQPPEPLEWGLAGPREASCRGDKCVWGGSIDKVTEPIVLFPGSKVMQDPSG